MEKFSIIIPQCGDFLLLGLKKTFRKNAKEMNPLVFPGGHIRRGETPTTAAIRELVEETTFRASEDDLRWIGVVRDLSKRQLFYVFSFLMRDKTQGENISKGSPDLYELKWLSQNALPFEDMLPEHSEWVLKTLGSEKPKLITLREKISVD